MAGFDEAYEKFQIDELDIGAAVLKHEESKDGDFIKARDEWTASMTKFMMGGHMQGVVQPGFELGEAGAPYANGPH